MHVATAGIQADSFLTAPEQMATACLRSIQAALAAWIEEQSGLSLLTPEGECMHNLAWLVH